ncbi:MAG: hypothetical protein JXB50_03280 [Spirochaetes bacterium]|nr:hypothetical protein [Spirochaetota bacterium]
MEDINCSVLKKEVLDEQNVKMESVLINYKFFFPNDVERFNIVVVFPLTFINNMVKLVFETDKKITINNLNEYLIKINEYFEKRNNIILKNFNYKEKRELKLDTLKEETVKTFVKNKITSKKIKTIEEIVQVDDKIIQLAVSKMKQRELEIVIKLSSNNIKNKILNNLSKNAREYYLEELKLNKRFHKFEIKAYIIKFINVINSINLQ